MSSENQSDSLSAAVDGTSAGTEAILEVDALTELARHSDNIDDFEGPLRVVSRDVLDAVIRRDLDTLREIDSKVSFARRQINARSRRKEHAALLFIDGRLAQLREMLNDGASGASSRKLADEVKRRKHAEPILRALSGQEMLPFGKLTAITDLSPQQLSNELRWMEQLGLTNRLPSGRETLVSITTLGAAAIAASPAVNDLPDPRLNDLEIAKMIDQLQRTMRAFQNTLDRNGRARPPLRDSTHEDTLELRLLELGPLAESNEIQRLLADHLVRGETVRHQRSDFHAGWNQYAIAQELARRLPGGPDPETRVRLLDGLVSMAFHRGRLDLATGFANEGIDFCQDYPDELARARFHVWRADIANVRALNPETLANVRSALSLLEVAHASDPARRQRLIARAHRIRGSVLVRLCEWNNAETALDTSFRALDSADCQGPACIAERAYLKHEWVRLYLRRGNMEDFDKAKKCSQKGLDYRNSIGDFNRGRARFCLERADILHAERIQSRLDGKTDEEELRCLFEALRAFERMGDELNVLRASIRLSRYFRAFGQHVEARYRAEHTLESAPRIGSDFYLGIAYRTCGMVDLTEARSGTTDLRLVTQLEESGRRQLEMSIALLHPLDEYEAAISRYLLGTELSQRPGDANSEQLVLAMKLLNEAVATFRSKDAASHADIADRRKRQLESRLSFALNAREPFFSPQEQVRS